MERFLPFFLIFAVLWALQLYATYRQSKRFMDEVARLRRLGETAIGTSTTSRIRPRTLVALSADAHDRVTGAVEMRGLTVLVRPRPVPELEGHDLTMLAHVTNGDRRARASAMAARVILGLPADGTTGS